MLVKSLTIRTHVSTLVFAQTKTNIKVHMQISEIRHICVTWYILGQNVIFLIEKASSLRSFWLFKLPALTSFKSMQMSFILFLVPKMT